MKNNPAAGAAGPPYHFFRAGVARSHGVNAAIVYNHIRFLCCCVAKGKPVELSIAKLAMLYPYLGERAVRNALAALTQGKGCSSPLVLRLPVSGSRRSSYVLNGPMSGQRRLMAVDTAVAAEHGTVAAIIYASITRRILKNWEAAADRFAAKMDVHEFPTDPKRLEEYALEFTRRAACHEQWVECWQRWHSFLALSTVYRGFAQLVRAGLLVKSVKTWRLPVWSLPPSYPGLAHEADVPQPPSQTEQNAVN